jgi:hypothetical protein
MGVFLFSLVDSCSHWWIPELTDGFLNSLPFPVGTLSCRHRPPANPQHTVPQCIPHILSHSNRFKPNRFVPSFRNAFR